MGGKSDAPAAPDFYGLANEQGQISSNLLQQQTTANRPNTTTPFGSTMWNYDPRTQQWSGSETLNPTLQQTLNTQENTGLTAANLGSAEAGAAGGLLNGEVNNGLFNPIDYSNVGNVQSGNYYDPKAQDAVWNEFQTMQKPLQDQQMEQQVSSLNAQGLRPGDTAYDNSVRNLQNTQFEQQQAAEDQAVLAGEQSAQAMQGMDLQAQQANLNTDNAEKMGQLNLFSGLMPSQSGVPTNTNLPYTTAGVSQTPNLMGAGENAYGAALNSTNASNAAAGNLWGGLASIAALAMM